MKDLTPAQQHVVLLFLSDLARNNRGRLPHGAFKAAAMRLGYCRRTPSQLWHAYKTELENPNLVNLLGAKRKGRCGRKPIAIDSLIASVPSADRLTIRCVAAKTGIARTTVWRKIQTGILVTRTSRLKPTLTPASRAARLRYCLDRIVHDEALDVLKFEDFNDTVFVDEKWFFIDLVSRRYILLPNEPVPRPTTRHKNHIVKVMFMSAVARPRRDVNRNRHFDGKLGIWPFVVTAVAVRSSKARPRGTMVVVPTTVDRPAYTDMLLQKLVPALLDKWPRDVRHISVQQDNAGPHIKPGLLWAGHGLEVTMVCQPPSSPDFNILDLGYFNSIQALQQKSRCKSVVELLRVVQLSFANLPKQSLENVFYTLFRCMESSMLIGGYTTYKMPRSHKAKLRKTPGALDSLEHCSLEAWLSATEALEALDTPTV
jgi:hypothetical protein